jgi:hypothetical protein
MNDTTKGQTTTMEIEQTLSHGELMAELGMALGVHKARSAVLNALYSAKYRALTEAEISETLDALNAIADKHQANYDEACARRDAR